MRVHFSPWECVRVSGQRENELLSTLFLVLPGIWSQNRTHLPNLPQIHRQSTYQQWQCHSPGRVADKNTPQGRSVWESNRSSTLYPTGHRMSRRAFLGQKQTTSKAIPGSIASLQAMPPPCSRVFHWARLWLVQIGTLCQRWRSPPMLGRKKP